MDAGEERVTTSRAFSSHGRTPDMVPSFKYLERVLSEADDDWPVVIRNLKKAWAFWRKMKRILSKEGLRQRVPIFYVKSVVQLVLLFGTETWVVTPCMGWVMGSFQD